MIYACITAFVLTWGTGYAFGFSALTAAVFLFLGACGVILPISSQLGILLLVLGAPMAALLLGKALEGSFEHNYPMHIFSVGALAFAAAMLLQPAVLDLSLEQLIALAQSADSSSRSLGFALSLLSRIILCAGIGSALILILVMVVESLLLFTVSAGAAQTHLPTDSVKLLLLVLIPALCINVLSAMILRHVQTSAIV